MSEKTLAQNHGINTRFTQVLLLIVRVESSFHTVYCTFITKIYYENFTVVCQRHLIQHATYIFLHIFCLHSFV